MNMDMKNIFKYTLVTLAAASMLTACDLDLFPVGSLVYNPESVITNETDLTGFEAGVIAQFRGIAGGGVLDEPQDIMMDYFNALGDYGNNYGGVHRTDDSFSADDYDSRDNWRYPYLAIRHFNIVINGAQTVPDGLQAKAAIARGEAYVARAYAYLHMIRLFAKPYGSSSSTDLGLPIILKYDQTERPSRNTVKEVYDQIKSDLDSAAVLLAGVKGEVRAQKPTIDFVNAMYARYYLDTKQYAQAASAAEKVIGSAAGYKLAATAEEFAAEFVEDNGKEPILQFYGSLQEGGYGEHTYYANMAIDSEEGHGQYYRPYFIPTKKLAEAYGEGDLRNSWLTDGSVPIYENGSWYTSEFKVFKKYSGNPALRTTDLPNTRQMLKPITIAEIYLIAAEAYAGAGNSAKATECLNALQTARGAEATSASTANIQNEWYRETVGQGLRISCLKRWGLGYSGRAPQDGAASAGVVITQPNFIDKSMPANDYHFVWPVPKHELQVNPNLVQNEGYAAITVE